MISEERVWRLRCVEPLRKLSELPPYWKLTVIRKITELAGPVLKLIGHGKLIYRRGRHLTLNGELRLAAPLGELTDGLSHRETLLLHLREPPEILKILCWKIPLIRHLALELVKIIGWRVAIKC